MTNGTEITPVELVIFGAAGDLTWRKLIPALYNLFLDHLIPEKFAIFGVDVRQMRMEDLRKHLLDGVRPIFTAWKSQP